LSDGRASDPTDPTGEITDLLRLWQRRGEDVTDELMQRVYGELHAMAARLFRGERREHTLQPTALVHEAYLRLAEQHRAPWQNRDQFFAMAARMMRRILVDHARGHERLKRGGKFEKVSFEDQTGLGVEHSPQLVALDEALRALERIDPPKAAVVELRFFGGLSVEETAETLGVSTPTVGRYWRLARAWLLRELSSSRMDAT
jgi:RNA polymerase sigma-70 factor (ECF subfamily)